MFGDHITLNLSSINSKDRPEYSTVETNNEYFEDFSIQPDIQYYQTHDFHKLAMKLDRRDKAHAFDVKVVSETWTSENNNNKNTMNNQTIPGYLASLLNKV